MEPSGPLSIVVGDILHEKSSFSHCGFVWTPREANKVPPLVARFGLVGNLPRDWITSRPITISNILQSGRAACMWWPLIPASGLCFHFLPLVVGVLWFNEMHFHDGKKGVCGIYHGPTINRRILDLLQ